jgi:hypothetical protein
MNKTLKSAVLPQAEAKKKIGFPWPPLEAALQIFFTLVSLIKKRVFILKEVT